jgi:hypothetical protein
MPRKKPVMTPPLPASPDEILDRAMALYGRALGSLEAKRRLTAGDLLLVDRIVFAAHKCAVLMIDPFDAKTKAKLAAMTEEERAVARAKVAPRAEAQA